MENKIPTEEEFFGFISGEIAYPPDFVHRTAIEFAKLHVEAALKAAVNNVEYADGNNSAVDDIDENSILNSYPLTNIK